MKRNIPSRTGRCLAWCLVAAALAAWPARARGVDAGPTDIDTPQNSVVEDPTQRPADPQLAELRSLAAETIALMQQAQAGFEAGTVSADGAAQQSEIVRRLQRLAELVQQQTATVAAAGRKDSSSGGASQATNAGDGQGAATGSLDAAESSESATGAAATAAGRSRTARDLATSVWGHLPARQRDRMQSRFSERFLPQYDRLVRQYYEALATEGLADE
jgi:hypothetical protein